MSSSWRKSHPGLVIAYGVAGFLVVAAVLTLALVQVLPRGSGGDTGPSAAPPAPAAVVSVPDQALPEDLQPPLEQASTAPVYDGDCLGVMELEEKPSCWWGDVDADQDLALFGDSHAAHLVPAFDEIGRQRQLRVLPFVLNACPSWEIPVDRLEDGTSNPYCASWREAQFEALNKNPPALIVVSNQTELYTSLTANPSADPAELIAEGVPELLDRLPEGVPVVILSDSITWETAPPTCLAENLQSVQECVAPRDLAPLYTAEAYVEMTAGREDVRVVDMLDLTCADQCYAVHDNLLIYQDTDHLSQDFVRWLTPALEQAVFPG